MAIDLTPADLHIVRQTPLFSGLSTAALAGLMEGAAVQNAPAGFCLFTQGEAAEAFYVVLSGWIKLYRMTPGGTEAVIEIFTRGQSFAEAAAFAAATFPVSCEAITDARLLRISARHLFERIRRSPDIGLTMLASTSKQLRLFVRQIEALKAYTGAQRIAEFLLELAPCEDGACTVELPYDKALIAARLGMKPESLSRAFNRLKDYGVEVKQRQADIASLERLRDFAERERAEIMRDHGTQD